MPPVPEPETLLRAPPFALDRAAKEAAFLPALAALTRHHHASCAPYRRIVDALGFDPAAATSVADFPFLPAPLFKRHDLKSVGDRDVIKVMTSSGTGGAPSRIPLDRATARLQSQALARIVGDFIGTARLPMLVIDAAATVTSRAQFSARAAGIVGFSLFGRDVTYALDDSMALDLAAIEGFLGRHAGEPVLLFGFTFIVWRHFVAALRERARRLPLDRGILIHGGGWKKLADAAVDAATFDAGLAEVAGIRRVHNYYGMVEQTGSIFVACAAGRLHCPTVADIIIRDAQFHPLPQGERGLVELVSLLPQSYPGHVLLTEDEGTIDGEDDCGCGRKGKYFRIHGRTEAAEARGCSDTYGR